MQYRGNHLQIPPAEEWLLKHSTEPLFGSKVKHTLNPAVRRENSSGEVSNVDLFDEVAPNESASQLGSRSLSLLGHFAHLFKKTQRTVITVTYGKKSETFDITTCTSWAHFLQKVDKSPKLKIPIHTREMYHYLPYGRHSYVSELSALQEGKEYYVETDLDKPTKFSPEMEQFFENLKIDEDMSDAQVEIAKESFSSQGITYKQLMKTGDLAMTDAELEKMGIVQLGLRKAILAVIKSNN